MLMVEAVVFDFIGTLAVLRGYSYEGAVRRMFTSLVEDGFNVDFTRFMEVYEQAQQKYRNIRYEKLVEVTNAVWLSEALNKLGYNVKTLDNTVKKAVNTFFMNYFDSLQQREHSLQILKALSERYILGLVSNFTYTPVVYAGLRKLGFNNYFNAIVVSQEVGWRKPSAKIFNETLKRLHMKPAQTIFVGDSPLEDIKGAKNVGMKTVFIPSQFFSVQDLKRAQQKSDFIIEDLHELSSILF